MNSRHVGRLQGILSRSPVASVEFGDLSRINADNCFIPPIILRDPSLNDAVLNEEIFGPILPIIAIDSIDEALQIVNQVCPRPLAFYQFAEDKAVQDRLLVRILYAWPSIADTGTSGDRHWPNALTSLPPFFLVIQF